MIGNLSGWHLLVVVLIVLLLFGATKLPLLARGVGQSLRIFKQEVRTLDEAGDESTPASNDPAAAATAHPASPVERR